MHIYRLRFVRCEIFPNLFKGLHCCLWENRIISCFPHIMSSEANSDEEYMPSHDTAQLGLQLLLHLRHILTQSQQQWQRPDVTQHVSDKQTQTDESCIMNDSSSRHYTRNDVRSAVHNERVKGKLKTEISVLKERCAFLEQIIADRGNIAPSTSKHCAGTKKILE